MQQIAEFGLSHGVARSHGGSAATGRLAWPLAASLITLLSLLSWATLIWFARALF